MSGRFSTPSAHPRHPGTAPEVEAPTHPPTRMPTHSLGLLAKLAMVAAGVALGVACAETAGRLAGFEFRPHMRNRVYFAEPDALLGWRNRAALAGPYGGEEFLTQVTLNADRQRGRRHPRERTPGTTRIAVLGDSQAWGDGVNDEETFSALLERGGIEVLNFACLGYGTDQELLTLDHVAARWMPDVVVVAAFVGNDLQDNLSPGTWQYPKPHFTAGPDGALDLRGVPVHPPQALHLAVEAYRAAMRHSVLLNACAEATTDRSPPRPTAASTRSPTPIYRSLYTAAPSDADRRGLALTGRLLLEIARRAWAMGARPVVLLLPELWQVDVARNPEWRADLRRLGARWRRPQQELRRVLEPAGVEVIDALPVLARFERTATASEATTYYRRWRHLNARGHQAVARQIAARLGLPGGGAAARLRPGTQEAAASATGPDQVVSRRADQPSDALQVPAGAAEPNELATGSSGPAGPGLAPRAGEATRTGS